jgi:predicted nucleic acid-binding protein
MTAYLDSSIVLRHLLAGEDAIRHALEFPDIVSSELLDIECRRVFFRCRLAGELDDEGFVEAMRRYEDLLDGIDLMDLSRAVRQRAREAFPLNVRTLDALHLSTALLIRKAGGEDSLQVFSHDQGMNLCARALGMGTPLL